MITKKDLIREIQNQNAGHTGYLSLYFRKAVKGRGYDYSRSDSVSPIPGWSRLGVNQWFDGTSNILTYKGAEQILFIMLNDPVYQNS